MVADGVYPPGVVSSVVGAGSAIMLAMNRTFKLAPGSVRSATVAEAGSRRRIDGAQVTIHVEPDRGGEGAAP